MKILMVNSGDPRRWGGAEVWMRRALGLFSAMGHEVAGLARAGSPALEGPRARAWNGRADALARELRAFRPDLVVALQHADLRDLWWHRAAAPSARRVQARHLPSFRTSVKRRWMYRRMCDALWVPSEFMRRLLQELDGVDPSRVHVVTQSVGPREARPEPTGPPALVCVGRLSREKGQDVLLRALAAMRTPARLLLVGAGPEEGALRALAEELRLGERVRWCGALQDLAPFYAEAHAAVQPSRVESFGLSALEALARGVPLVASDVGGLAEVAGECAARVPADDVPALAMALDHILEDAALRARLAECGRLRAEEKFSEEVERRALAAALEGSAG